jgi:hypothetical protein
MHKILLTQRALRDLDSMDFKAKKRIISKLKEVRTDLILHSQRHTRIRRTQSHIGTFSYTIAFIVSPRGHIRQPGMRPEIRLGGLLHLTADRNKSCPGGGAPPAHVPQNKGG